MLKNVSKRMVALLMVLAMLIPLMPVMDLSIHVHAAEGPALSVDGLTLTTSGNATWTGSGTSVDGSVAGTDASGSGCNKVDAKAQNGTLTFINSLASGKAAYLTFDYNITANNGSVKIGSETLTDSGSYSVLIEASLDINLVITSGAGSKLTTAISITNVKLTEVSSIDITFMAPENGSYTVDGEAITADTVKHIEPPVTYSVAATAADGYKFVGWYSSATNGYLAYTETANITVNDVAAIYPVFIDESTPIFSVGSSVYTDLNEANDAAKNASDKLIVLIQSGTLEAGTYEISAGVKLLIPYNAAYTADFDETPGVVNNAKEGVHVKPTEFRKLTLTDGAVVNCYGQINVNSQMYVCTNVRTSTTTGPYGAIDITSGGKLVMESGSNLYAYGYIGGEGTVEGKSGSSIYQMMQICDWRGGSATSSLSGTMKGNSFLFSQYYLQNIEALLKVNSGSTMYAVTGLTAGSGILNQMKQVSAPIIGTDKGLFRFNADRVDDYMTLMYDSATDRMNVELYGQVSTVSIDMKVSLGIGMNFSLNTDEYILPIPMNFTINVKSGSTVSFTEKFKLLPGTKIIVEDGASVTVGTNGAVYLYDVDDWNSGNYSHLAKIYQLNYVHATKGAPVTRTPNKDSVLQIDGTLNAMGPIYSTDYSENGGDACITGNGTVTIGVHGTLSLKEINGNNTDDIKTITCVPVLGKVVGHEGNVSLDIGTYKSINDQWYQYTMTFTDTEYVSGGLEVDGTVYVSNAKDAPAQIVVKATYPCVQATNASVTNNGDGTYTISDIQNNSIITSAAHTLKDIAAVDPDCVNPGHTAGVVCEVCGEYTTPTTEIPALGHTVVVDKAVEPTCTETGLTEGSHCSVCDTVLVAQTVVPAHGHTHETILGKAPTCTETGLTEGVKCSVCNEIITEQTEIDALGHDHSYVVEGSAINATCTTPGKESDMQCVRCDSVVTGAEVPATGHNYSIVVEGSAVAPTCTVNGKEVDVKCANCDDVKIGDTVLATGHDEVIDAAVAPTCTETGLTEGSHCATCKEVIRSQDVVDALGHDYVAVVTAPTCEDQGYTTHTCSRCDDSYVDSHTDPIASNHNYDSVTTITPTCTEEGYDANVCSICGHKEKIEDTEKPAYGHTFTFGVLTPTCTTGGHTVRTCEMCDYSDIVDVVEPLGHDCVSTVTSPTCTEQGYTTHTCSRCDYTHIPADSYKPAYGHQYEVSVFPATCTEGGYNKYECMDCGHTYIPDETRTDALGHCYYKDYIEVIVTPPTCTEQGYTTHNCYCGEHSHVLDYVPATGHSYGEWVTTKPATCTEDGERTKTCAGCSDVITETVPATGHSHVPTVTAPTCTEKGYTTFTCACGDTYVDNYVDAKGHIEVDLPGRDATCKEVGLTEGKQCATCGEILVAQVEIEKLDHAFGNWTTTKVPNCTVEGEEARMCSVCGTTETKSIAKTAHIVVIDPAVPARYDKTGLTEGSHCSACNEVLVAQEEVAMLVLDWETFKQGIMALEYYANLYAKSNPGKDPMKLMINYLRTGVDRYNDDAWETMAGAPETSFIKDVLAYDDIYGTHAYALREMDGLEITMPNGEKMEFDHLFGAMNVSSKNNYGVNNTDFGSWVGDLCDLMLFVWEGETFKGGYSEDNYATIDELMSLINKEYFGKDASSAFTGSFSIADINADLDVFYFVDKIKDGETSLLAIFEELYTTELSEETRAAYFLNNRFPGSMTNEAVRESIFTTYKDNFLVQVLESSREISGYPKLREACSYAFADYLFELADGLLVEPEEEEKPGEDEEEKKVYEVFNSTSSVLAPGVNQTINYAVNAKGEQIVFFTATADIRRDDVNVYANYANNDPSKGWQMSPVSAQMNAAIQNNKDVPNYNPVVGVNSNFYNMSTGEPSGVFVMNSTVYKEGGSAFFAILNNGTAVIGNVDDYARYKGNIAEAVGGSTVLVKDGVSLFPNPDNSYAPRTAVGITADGKVVVMVIDGRQSPYSAGANFNEIAQIMIDAGCVDAINLDGGGSSTFVSKAEGSDALSVLNRPCDTVERSVSSSLMFVSTAPTSKEFHHAVVNTPTDYITIGSSFNINLIGVGEAGNTAEIPAGAYLQVSDASKGSISGNTFKALAVGKVDIQVVVNGTVVGTKSVNVIRRPTALAFGEANMNAIYGVASELPLIATYYNSPVTVNPGDIVFEMSNATAGVMDGFAFVGTESSGVRNVTITAKLAEDASILASMGLRLYSADESIFDFDNADAGNTSLAWNRDIVNTFTIDNKTYFTIDPSKDVYANYVFALDMKAIQAPVRLQPLMEYLNGFAEGVGDNAGPWDYLLALGGRVSDLTTVTVKVTFPEGVDIDISDITFVQDFMNIQSTTYDEKTNTLTMVLSWIRQTAGIDASTANSIAIISGIKLTPNGVGDITISGNVTYDIYLDTSQLHSFAKDPANQQKYGIYDYINPDDPEDAGGHFADTYINFEDNFSIKETSLNGWVTGGVDNDLYYYYINNEMVTGIELVPDREGTGKSHYYDFGTDGICVGTYTGMFYDEDVGGYRYVRIGEAITGWVRHNEVDYYVDPVTGCLANGRITTTDYITFDFVDGRPLSGVWTRSSDGYRYWYGPTYYRSTGGGIYALVEIDGEYYLFNYYGYRKSGLVNYRDLASGEVTLYNCSENGVATPYTGPQGDIFMIDGKQFKGYKLIAHGDTFYCVSSGYKLIKGKTVYVSETFVEGVTYSDGTPVAPGRYTFDENGCMVIGGESGVDVVLNGVVGDYFYINNVQQKAYQLVKYNGYYYCISDAHKIVKGRKVYLSEIFVGGKTFEDGTPIPVGRYEFDSEGRMVILNGPIDGYLYINNSKVPSYTFVEYNGDFYYTTDYQKYVTNKTINLTEAMVAGKYFANGDPLYAGKYTFGADGKMEVVNGPVGDYFYINNVQQKAYQLVKYNGYYYCISDAHKLIKGRTVYLSETFVSGKTFEDGTPIPVGRYEFDSEGRMVILDGPVDGYFYINNKKIPSYTLIEYNGAFYCTTDYQKLITNRTANLPANMVAGKYFADGSPMHAGRYEFDADGKMIIKNGPIDGYFYINDIKQPSYTLIEYNGAFYCTTDYQKLITNRTATLTESMVAGKYFADGSPMYAGRYKFDEEGKMVILNGPVDGYFYINGVRQGSYKIFEYEGAFYCTTDYQKLIVNKKAYFSAKFVSGIVLPDGSYMAEGTYYFDEFGRIVW